MTAPTDEPDFTSPNGKPDWLMHENEARLWWLSETERRAGAKVEWNEETHRWQRGEGIDTVESKCAICSRNFRATRKSMVYCSAACNQKAKRKRYSPAITGGTA